MVEVVSSYVWQWHEWEMRKRSKNENFIIYVSFRRVLGMVVPTN